MSIFSQIVRISRGSAAATPSPVGSAMWRLLPLLAVLGFLEILVPWPNVAALVLSDANNANVRAVSPRRVLPNPTPGAASAISSELYNRQSADAGSDPTGLLVRARVISH